MTTHAHGHEAPTPGRDRLASMYCDHSDFGGGGDPSALPAKAKAHEKTHPGHVVVIVKAVRL